MDVDRARGRPKLTGWVSKSAASMKVIGSATA
jgi:hypothetical protein